MESFTIAFSSSDKKEERSKDLKQRASEFVKRLTQSGIGANGRPVIFVCHSMGGLLAKEVLMQCRRSEDVRQRQIFDNARGCVFFSTPHVGADIAQAKDLPVGWIYVPSLEVVDLANVPLLTKLNEEFRPYTLPTNDSFDSTRLTSTDDPHIKVLSFGEGRGMKYKHLSQMGDLLSLLIVPRKSSNPGFGEYHFLDDADHLNVCKPHSPLDENYLRTVHFIRSIVHDVHQAKKKH